MKLRDAESSDYRAIAELGEKSGLFLDDLTSYKFAKMMKWIFKENPEKLSIQYIAEGSEGIVAHYGAIPYKYKWNEREESVALASNLVIAKGVRRPLFYEMQRELIKRFRTHNFGFVFASVTRPGLLDVHLGMGWKKVGVLHVYARPIALHNVFRKIIKQPFLAKHICLPAQIIQRIWDKIYKLKPSSIEVIKISKFDESISPLLSAWMSSRDICSMRTVDILNWRFFGCEEREYKVFKSNKELHVTGYLVARLMPMKGFMCVAIVDLVVLPNDGDSFSALMKECIKYAQDMGADLISTVLSDYNENGKDFKKAGFLNTREKFTILGQNPKNNTDDIERGFFSSWHINWFDHDYV